VTSPGKTKFLDDLESRGELTPSTTIKVFYGIPLNAPALGGRPVEPLFDALSRTPDLIPAAPAWRAVGKYLSQDEPAAAVGTGAAGVVAGTGLKALAKTGLRAVPKALGKLGGIPASILIDQLLYPLYPEYADVGMMERFLGGRVAALAGKQVIGAMEGTAAKAGATDIAARMQAIQRLRQKTMPSIDESWLAKLTRGIRKPEMGKVLPPEGEYIPTWGSKTRAVPPAVAPAEEAAARAAAMDVPVATPGTVTQGTSKGTYATVQGEPWPWDYRAAGTGTIPPGEANKLITKSLPSKAPMMEKVAAVEDLLSGSKASQSPTTLEHFIASLPPEAPPVERSLSPAEIKTLNKSLASLRKAAEKSEKKGAFPKGTVETSPGTFEVPPVKVKTEKIKKNVVKPEEGPLTEYDKSLMKLTEDDVVDAVTQGKISYEQGVAISKRIKDLKKRLNAPVPGKPKPRK
jgi:hypothetical protein